MNHLNIVRPAIEGTVTSSPPDWLRLQVAEAIKEALRQHGEALPAPPAFTDLEGLKRQIPAWEERRLRELVKKKIIPAVRPPGSRNLLFHWPSVEAALLRWQKGGNL